MSTRSGVRAVYADQAPRYDQHWASYLHASLGPTLEALELPTGGRVVDVGCGTGLLLERLLAGHSGAEAWGVDLSPEMLTQARARLGRRARLLLGDASALPLPDQCFDAAASSSALHHWSDPERALREIARVLRPGGQLVLTDWADEHLVTRLRSAVLRHTDPSHHRTYTVRGVERMLRAAGFAPTGSVRHSLGWRWGFWTVAARTPPAPPLNHDP